MTFCLITRRRDQYEKEDGKEEKKGKEGKGIDRREEQQAYM